MARPKSMRGREPKRIFLSFGVGPVGIRGREFLIVLVALRE